MTKFALHVQKVWDALMPSKRWFKWNDPELSAEDADKHCEDTLRFATDIARTAFEAGVNFACLRNYTTPYDVQKELDERYPLPKVTKWRTSKRDSNGNVWQVRDGNITWIAAPERLYFREHIHVEEVIKAMIRLGDFYDAALVAELAANPTEE